MGPKSYLTILLFFCIRGTLIGSSVCAADTVKLKDGRTFEGAITEDNPEHVGIQTIIAGIEHPMTFARSDVEYVRRGTGAQNQTPAAPARPVPANPIEKQGVAPSQPKDEEEDARSRLGPRHSEPESQSGEDRPRLGCWTLTHRNADGKTHSARLVIESVSDSMVMGYVTRQLPEAGMVNEVITGVYDPSSRVLTLRGSIMQIRSKKSATHIPVFSMTLGKTGRTLTDTGSGWSAKFSGNNTLAKDEEFSKFLSEPTSDRQWLYQNLASPLYIVEGTSYLRKPDPSVLEGLSRSTDPHTAALAKRYLPVVIASERQATSDAAAKWGDVRRMQAAIVEGALSGDPLEAFRSAAQPVFERVEKAVVDYKKISQNYLNICQMVQNEFVVSHDGADCALEPTSVNASYSIERYGEVNLGWIALKNSSGHVLHHCVITTRVRVDRTSAEQFDFWARLLREVPAYVGLEAAGFSPVQSVLLREAMERWQFGDTATLTYLPEWGKDEVVQVPLREHNQVDSIVSGLDAWLGCDEGSVQVDTTPVRSSIEAMHTRRVETEYRKWKEIAVTQIRKHKKPK